MDNTAYLLDLLVQSFGFFWQTFVQLMWHTDVFERLGPAYGSQDRGRFIPEGFQVNLYPHFPPFEQLNQRPEIVRKLLI